MGWFDKRRESELRRIGARTLYDFEVECRRQARAIQLSSTMSREACSGGPTGGSPSPVSTQTGSCSGNRIG